MKVKVVANGMPVFPKAAILGVKVDMVSMKDALSFVEKALQSDSCRYIITADSSSLYSQQHDPELHQIYEDADLVTPDSHGVLWAAKRKGFQLTERVSGIDLITEITELSSKKGYKIYYLGSAAGVAEQAAEKMRLKHPGCNIVGVRNGFFPASDDVLVADEIAKAKPDVVFVAMGIPRQEKFIHKTKEILGAKICIGVGGSLDVLSGTTKRAPLVIQRLKLEWFWRVVLNPKKFSKVATLPKFMVSVLAEKHR